MTLEEKYILLMEAAYTATDKGTYYKLMQKADQVLKTLRQLQTVWTQKRLNEPQYLPQILPCKSQIALGIGLSVGQLYADPAYRIDLSDHFLLNSSR